MKEVLLSVLFVLLSTGLIIFSVFFFTKDVPERYSYCASGFRGTCFLVDTKEQVTTNQQGCITNGEDVICGSYSVKKGKY